MVQRQHSDEIKAQVLAALLTGQSVSVIARDYHIARTTIQGWRAAAGLHPTLPDTKKEEFGELIADYLRENIITLAIQAKVFRDAEWLKKQPASEVAVLHGVLTDKAIRLLEALEPIGGDEAND